MKAEENMMNLLEDNQKQQRFALLPCAAGIVLLILTGLFAIFTHMLLPDMLDLWDFQHSSFTSESVAPLFY